jgi:CrcB protein
MRQRVDLATLGYVVVGGALGVLARAALLAPIGDAALVPWATLAINAAGSLLLGAVVGALADRHRHARALLGTGVLGGFTTYSALAVETAVWLTTPWLAIGLAAASVTAGAVGAVAGLLAGRRMTGRPGTVAEPGEAE